jgi:GntR family transcriptional repressor for pyruvate dehydrogenase complex
MTDITFKPYRSKRAFEDVAEEIRQAILADRLKEGDRLPAERSLAEQFQVGRLTVREALRNLETSGLVTIKKGSSGGAFVRVGDPERLSGMIIDNLVLEGLDGPQITEARIGLELAVVESAINNATQKDLNQIEQDIEGSKLLVDPGEVGVALSKMIRFHVLLAEASHNLAFIMFVRALMEWGRRRRAHWIPSAREQAYSYRSHKQIFQAVKRKNLPSARRLMKEHILYMGRLVARGEMKNRQPEPVRHSR